MLENMSNARALITEGLAQRAAAGIKVRQPLAKATVRGLELSPALQQIVADELNVKEIVNTEGNEPEIAIDAYLTDELVSEGFARDLIRHIQELRKYANLNVDDRIEIRLEPLDDYSKNAIEANKDLIFKEILAKEEMNKPKEGVVSKQVAIDDHTVSIAIQRA